MTGEHAGPRVLIDATAVPFDRGGVGRYVDGLLSELTGDIVIACQERDAVYYAALAPLARVVPQKRISKTPIRLLWEQFVLVSVAKSVRATVIFSPHYTIPLATRLPRVVTFHDATFFSDPDLHTPLKRLFFRIWMRLSARHARAIIVPSAATASELTRYVDRPSGFTVALHGVDHERFTRPTAKEVAQFRDVAGLGPEPWIGFLGTIEPRKNVPALVLAYADVVSRWQPTWGDVPTLALAGGRGWETELDSALSTVRSPGRVTQLGFIDIERLRAFLGGAELICYPSLGEGFGLPVLEAMACGASVLTTRRLALPEVGGNAVAYSDVTVSAISTALEDLLSQPALQKQLSEAGVKRAAMFTWRASAMVHELVFRQVTS
jgi:glycosyltransferase involved in cell wall biosynthesis